MKKGHSCWIIKALEKCYFVLLLYWFVKKILLFRNTKTSCPNNTEEEQSGSLQASFFRLQLFFSYMDSVTRIFIPLSLDLTWPFQNLQLVASVELLLHAWGCLLVGKSKFFSGGGPPADRVRGSSRIRRYFLPAGSLMLPLPRFIWRWCVCDNVQLLLPPNTKWFAMVALLSFLSCWVSLWGQQLWAVLNILLPSKEVPTGLCGTSREVKILKHLQTLAFQLSSLDWWELSKLQ